MWTALALGLIPEFLHEWQGCERNFERTKKNSWRERDADSKFTDRGEGKICHWVSVTSRSDHADAAWRASCIISTEEISGHTKRILCILRSKTLNHSPEIDNVGHKACCKTFYLSWNHHMSTFLLNLMVWTQNLWILIFSKVWCVMIVSKRHLRLTMKIIEISPYFSS